MVQVDLRAPTISAATRVWRLFPGEGYQFLESFRDQRVGFLDFPGLDLPEGNLSDARDLIPRIARTQRIIELLREAPDSDVELTLDEFANARVTQHRLRLRSALI